MSFDERDLAIFLFGATLGVLITGPILAAIWMKLTAKPQAAGSEGSRSDSP